MDWLTQIWQRTGAQSTTEQLLWFAVAILGGIALILLLVVWTWYLLQPRWIQWIVNVLLVIIVLAALSAAGLTAVGLGYAQAAHLMLVGWLEAHPLVKIGVIPALLFVALVFPYEGGSL